MVLAGEMGAWMRPIFLLDDSDTWSRNQIQQQGWDFACFDSEKLPGSMPKPAAVLIDTRKEDGLLNLIDWARRSRVPVLSIHDLGLNPIPSDAVIDGSLHPVVQHFPGLETELYTGTPYMILSPAYGILHERPKIIRKEIETVFVSLGGGDSGRYFFEILEGLRLSGKGINVVGVRGFSSWGQDDLERLKWHPIRFRWAMESEFIPDLLFGSDLAITAGGITAFEALCAGTPLLAVSHDAFQEITIEKLRVANACIDLGRGDLLKPSEIPPILKIVEEDRSERERMSQRGRMMVDGRGAERVVEIIRRSVDGRRRKIHRGRECSMR